MQFCRNTRAGMLDDALPSFLICRQKYPTPPPKKIAKEQFSGSSYSANTVTRTQLLACTGSVADHTSPTFPTGQQVRHGGLITCFSV